MEDNYYPPYQPAMAPEAQIPAGVYSYGQYAAQQPKSPASLVNHTGLSPGGPLSTPPTSRDASRGPEPLPAQYPGQLVYDGASESNSPTSVRTPDNDTFEVELLDSHSMHDFYQGNQGALTTQVSQAPLTSLDNNSFFTAQGTISDEAIHEAFNATMAAHPQQLQLGQFAMQTRPQQSIISQQSFNNYSEQPPTGQTGPWTSQGPPRNPGVPRSGVAVFDPATEFDHSAFLNIDVPNWVEGFTDPTYLVSPNEPVLPPQDLFAMTTENMMQQQTSNLQTHHSQNYVSYVPTSSPIEMRLHQASPPPYSPNFVNYLHPNPSPISPSIELPLRDPQRDAQRNALQSPASPMASASSPGGSEGMFSSYQQSDSGMDQLEPYPRPAFKRTLPPPSPVEVERSPSRTLPGSSSGVSPDPEPQTDNAKRPARKGFGPIRTAGRPGGRALGTHLDAKVAKAAHDMRKMAACWHCVLQRDKCTLGDTCHRCLKRSQRPNADCGLGCSRIKLPELSEYFLPTLVMQIHEDSHLVHFVSQFIHHWGNQEINVYLTCEQRTMPRMQVKVYEFYPRGQELLVQRQYQTNPTTLERYVLKKRSPALGMVQINRNEEKKYDRYLSEIVDHHLDAFGDICWAEDDNDFAPKLFKLMTRVKPKNDEEARLFKEVFRLIVCTYIMSHTLTMAEETKTQTLARMHSYTDPSAYVQNYTSPRMASRQLKHFFARLQRSILTLVLNKLQQMLKSSKGCKEWLAAFVAVVGVAMAQEDQQKNIHQVMATRAATEGFDPRDAQLQADIANREVDARMKFVAQLFRMKYHRKCNPIKDPDQDWAKEVGFENENSVHFVRSVSQLIKDNTDYLQQQQGVSISASNQGRYTARLVAPFLLSFWLP